MLTKLLELDRDLFLYLNHQHTPFLDVVMYWLSDKYVWFPFYALLLAFIIWKLKWKAVYVILALGLTVIATDQFSSGLMKPYFIRFRPCHDPYIQHLVRLVDKCGGQFGFVSSHAANAFGMATFVWLLFRGSFAGFGWSMLWAAGVSYSRVYMGVHYPADVLLGALSGVVIGLLFYRFYEWLLRKNYFRLRNL